MSSPLRTRGASRPLPGWERTDPRPWRSKCHARWKHPSGWELIHCGHPTAHWSWMLFAPDGVMHLTGGAISGNIEFGTCWPRLDCAMRYVAALLAGESPIVESLYG